MIRLIFAVSLGALNDVERTRVADILSAIACEILKGEHRETAQILIYPARVVGF